jgi:hypothetical protein
MVNMAFGQVLKLRQAGALQKKTAPLRELKGAERKFYESTFKAERRRLGR